MLFYLINARDKAGSLNLRMATRTAHLDWLSDWLDKVVMAGPVFAEDGVSMAGSTIVIALDSLDAARAFAAQDPYAQAGLFERVEIVPFKWAIGAGKPAA